MDCSPPGSSVHGILQARILAWVAMPFSRRSSRPRDQTHVSCLLHRQAVSLPLVPPGNPCSKHNYMNFFQEDSISSVQFSSAAQPCLTLCNPMNRSTPSLPVHHQLPEFTQTHVHQVSDAIQPSHPLSSPSPPAPNPSQHQGLFQWVNSSHEVAKVWEFQLQHLSFQWTPRTDLL